MNYYHVYISVNIFTNNNIYFNNIELNYVIFDYLYIIIISVLYHQLIIYI